jgi:single-strand selective monofunctional uracil DNA glycosylase
MSTSKYFAQESHQNKVEIDLVDNFLRLENDLISQLNGLSYGPDVEFIYNPIQYAYNLHKAFLKKFLVTHKKVLFLGINPGPWGMCQTGVNVYHFIPSLFKD